MADMMMPPTGGTPPMGGPPMNDPIKDNESFLNKTDLGVMAGERRFTPDQSVRDVLTELGIDVEGPATQLVEFAQKQSQNAEVSGKMKNIASSGQPKPMPSPQGPMPGPAPGPQGPPPSMEGLMNIQGA